MDLHLHMDPELTKFVAGSGSGINHFGSQHFILIFKKWFSTRKILHDTGGFPTVRPYMYIPQDCLRTYQWWWAPAWGRQDWCSPGWRCPVGVAPTASPPGGPGGGGAWSRPAGGRKKGVGGDGEGQGAGWPGCHCCRFASGPAPRCTPCWRLPSEAAPEQGGKLHRIQSFEFQCCGVGAGGAEIIWDLKPEPKLSF